MTQHLGERDEVGAHKRDSAGKLSSALLPWSQSRSLREEMRRRGQGQTDAVHKMGTARAPGTGDASRVIKASRRLHTPSGWCTPPRKKPAKNKQEKRSDEKRFIWSLTPLAQPAPGDSSRGWGSRVRETQLCPEELCDPWQTP